MRIAIFHELHEGGARRAVNEFARRLGKNNEVDLFIVDENNNKEDYKFFNSFNFYKFSSKKWRGGNWKDRLYKDSIELLRLRKIHKIIASDIDKGGYDVVFIHPSKFTQAPFILRYIKQYAIYYCQEVLRMVYEKQFELDKTIPFHKNLYEKIIRFARKKIDKKNIQSANLILANSKNTQKNLRTIYGLSSKVAYLGVDTDFFKPDGRKRDIDVLYVGAKDTIDGYYLLQDALKFLPKKIKVQFHITGENWISDRDLRKLYNKSKIVVCLAKNEPFGLIPLEAAACGVPVIALDLGGYRETVIDGKTGLLITDNANDLAQKIKNLLSNEKKRQKMGAEGRKNAERNWSWDKAVNQLQGFFHSVNLHSKPKTMSIKKRILVLLLIFLFAILLRLDTLNQIGRTWDEFLYIEQGYKLVELMRNADFNNSYFYTTYDHPPLVKYIYGIPAHLDVQKIVAGVPVFNYDYTFSRIISALMFCLGVVITAIIGWRLFNPLTGIISGIILSMLPFSLGLSQLVTTESLKILVHPIAIFSYIVLLEKFTWKKVVLAGLVTGFALQAKQSNALLLLVLGLAFYLQYRRIKKSDKRSFLEQRVKAFVLVIMISIATFFAIWPQALFHLNEISQINQKLWSVQFSPKPWQITLSPPEIFFGRLILTPVFYYIVYFFISIPLLILIFFFVGLRKILTKGNLYKYLIILWFFVPFLMSFYSWRQHGLRYIIEIYPAIALIAAAGFSFVVDLFALKNKGKFVMTSALILYLLANLWYVRPYYLDYFNELVGGTGTVWRYNLFQTGWWGQGIREAGLFIEDNVKSGSKIGLALSPGHTLPQFEYFHYATWNPKEKFDYVIVNHYHIIRDGFNDSSIRKNYRLIHEIKADGATLVYIYAKK